MLNNQRCSAIDKARNRFDLLNPLLLDALEDLEIEFSAVGNREQTEDLKDAITNVVHYAGRLRVATRILLEISKQAVDGA